MAINTQRQRGVTLIELVIVVTIVGILGSIALGSYRQYMLRSNRSDAVATLQQIAVAQEKFFLQNGRFAGSLIEVAAAPPAGLGVQLGASNTSPRGTYAISIAAAVTTFTATATAAGTQAQDTACGVFTLNESGARTPALSARCW